MRARNGRQAAAAVSLLALGTLVLGAPVLLVHLTGAHLHLHVRPGGRGWRGLLDGLGRSPDTATWWVIVSLALWLVWGWLLVSVLAEVAEVLVRGSGRGWSGRPARSRGERPGRGPGRSLAAALLGPLVVIVAATAREPAGARARAAVPVVLARAGAPESPLATGPGQEQAPVVSPSGRHASLLPAAPRSSSASAPLSPSAPARSPLSTVLVWAAGAATAFVVEEMRRLVDARRLRRLRMVPAHPAAPPTSASAPPASPPVVPPATSTLASAPPAPPLVVPPAPPSGSPAPVTSGLPVAGSAAAGLPTGRSEPTPAVLVRLIGEVSIDGAPGPFDRPKVVESLAYLAVHRDGVAKERWATALWPDRRMSPNSLNTALWQLRRALGVAVSGERHLPAARSGRLRLGAFVSTDLEAVASLVSEGSKESLRCALDLVRGRPFDGLGDPDWVVLEGHAGLAETLVAEAALALGELAFRDGDAAMANWAALRALRACPYDERLYELRMRAAAAVHNRAGVEAARADSRRVLGSELPPPLELCGVPGKPADRAVGT